MRAFIIGNGPSLSWTPLNDLINEITFATGKIHLIYPKVVWRPTYYFALDYTGPGMIEDMVTNVETSRHSFIRADRASDVELRRQTFEHPAKVTYFWPCRRHIGINYLSPTRPTDWHLPSVCAYGSTLGAMIQIAVTLGYGPLYLLGCDLGWPAHFDPSYGGYDDFPPETRDDTLRHMHSLAEQCSPVKIYNATLGGALEEHERVDFKEL